MKQPKKRRLVKGKDYDGWAIKTPDEGLSYSTEVYETREHALVWFPAKWIVRIKLVEVKP